MINFKKIYSKFVTLVIIFLILIAANSLVGMFMSSNDKIEVKPENLDLGPSSDIGSDRDINPDFDTSSDLNTNLDDIAKDSTASSDSTMDDSTTDSITDSATKISPITYEAKIDDQNAFDLLKDVAKVEYKEYDFGVFVESINGIEGNDKNFWAFYLNGEQAQAGVDQTILQKGDKVEWRYEEIK